MKCAIWNTSATEVDKKRDGIAVHSPRAGGNYFVSGSAASKLHSLSEFEKVSLTSWLVDQRIEGKSWPEISTTTFTKISKDHMSAQKRAKNLLWYLYLRKDLLGTAVTYHYFDNKVQMAIYEELLAWTASTKSSEIEWLALSCKDKGWVDFHWNSLTLTLRLPGIEYLTGKM